MTYFDTYLSGAPDRIDAVLTFNADSIAAVIGPRLLDGFAHACVRQDEDAEALVVPPDADYLLEDLMVYPQTARALVGGFMPDPEPPEVPDNELPPEDTVDGGTEPEPEDTVDGGGGEPLPEPEPEDTVTGNEAPLPEPAADPPQDPLP